MSFEDRLSEAIFVGDQGRLMPFIDMTSKQKKKKNLATQQRDVDLKTHQQMWSMRKVSVQIFHST